RLAAQIEGIADLRRRDNIERLGLKTIGRRVTRLVESATHVVERGEKSPAVVEKVDGAHRSEVIQRGAERSKRGMARAGVVGLFELELIGSRTIEANVSRQGRGIAGQTADDRAKR